MLNQSLDFDPTARSLNIIFFAMMAAQMVLMGAFTLILRMGPPQMFDQQLDRLLSMIAPIVNLLAIGTGHFLYRIKVGSVDEAEDAATKLAAFRTAVILRLAILEGANILNCIAYFMTGNFQFQVMFLIVIVLFYATGKPSREKLDEFARPPAVDRDFLRSKRP